MTDSGFPDKAWVKASTSHLFPAGCQIRFDRIEQGKPRARLFLEKEGHAPEHLFDEDLPDLPIPGTGLAVRGDIPGENGRKLRLVITICTGQEPDLIPKYLVGQIFDTSKDIDTGGTGVWVAEERPETPRE